MKKKCYTVEWQTGIDVKTTCVSSINITPVPMKVEGISMLLERIFTYSNSFRQFNKRSHRLK